MKAVSPGETIISEGLVGIPALYVIKDGKVELSVTRGDVKIVLGTLGKGQFFGESVLVSAGPRYYTAKALSYCELQVIGADALKSVANTAPAIMRHMLRTLILSGMKKDEMLANHENMQAQPDFLTYAHILALMAGGSDGQGRRGGRDADAAALPMAEVAKKCREVTGHSRHHVGSTLKRMALLNLIALDNASLDMTVSDVLYGAQTVRFNPADIASRAQELAKHNPQEKLHAEAEFIELSDLETLTGVERAVLLRKLAQGEIAQAIFNFRRSEVLRYISEKGKDYFAKRLANGQMQSVEDLALVDKRILFEALSTVDDFDLARLLHGVADRGVREKLFACMTKAKREEIERLMKDEGGGDPDEVELIEQALLETVRALRAPGARAAAPADAEDGYA